jgi:hypothetical protein
VPSQDRRRRPVLVHPPKTLRHLDDRSVLRPEFLQMTLSALDDEDRLRQIRGVDDGELRAGWSRRQDENNRSDKGASHHWTLLLSLTTES